MAHNRGNSRGESPLVGVTRYRIYIAGNFRRSLFSKLDREIFAKDFAIDLIFVGGLPA